MNKAWLRRNWPAATMWVGFLPLVGYQYMYVNISTDWLSTLFSLVLGALWGGIWRHVNQLWQARLKNEMRP